MRGFLLATVLVLASAVSAADKPLFERIKDAGLADKPFNLIVSMKVKKNDLAGFLAGAEKAEVATRKEAGCVVYTFQQDTDDTTQITLLETWKDLPALEAHMKEEHTKTLLASFGKYAEGPVTLKLTKNVAK